MHRFLSGSKPPNILFLLTDQQRHDALGAVNPEVRTPHLDQLATEGVLFEKAYCANPSCVPSRASIATGRWPSHCGAPTYMTYLFDNEITTASLLREAGYETFVTGKQHFGSSGIDRGYCKQVPIPQLAFGTDPATQPDNPYFQFLASRGIRDLSELARRIDGVPATSEWVGDPELHVDQFIGQQGLRWLREERPKDGPWYCEISFQGPHTPYDGLGLPWADLYDRDAIPMPTSTHEDWKTKPPHWSKFSGYSRTPWHRDALTDAATRANAIRTMRHAYLAKVSAIDSHIGRILDFLRGEEDFGNTLVVFTSDHGDFQGEFSLVAKAQYLAEALIRVPLIVKPPGLASGCGRRVGESFVSTIDLARTFLSVAGIAVPEQMGGTDLSPWCSLDATPEVQTEAYFEAQGMRGIRYENWKLVHYRERDYGELYDLDADPAERFNLWAEPAFRIPRQELTSRLLDKMIAISPKSGKPWNKNNPEI